MTDLPNAIIQPVEGLPPTLAYNNTFEQLTEGSLSLYINI